MDDIKKAEFSQIEESDTVKLHDTKEIKKDKDFAIKRLEKLLDVELEASVELGKTKLTLSEALDIDNGSVIELDKIAGEAVSFYINGNLFGKGEVVVVGEKYGIRITELMPDREIPGDIR